MAYNPSKTTVAFLNPLSLSLALTLSRENPILSHEAWHHCSLACVGTDQPLQPKDGVPTASDTSTMQAKANATLLPDTVHSSLFPVQKISQAASWGVYCAASTSLCTECYLSCHYSNHSTIQTDFFPVCVTSHNTTRQTNVDAPPSHQRGWHQQQHN